MLVGEETDCAGQPVTHRRRVAQTAPVHALKARHHFLGQSGGEAGLANAAHPQQRYQPTAVGHHPLAQQRQFLGASHEAGRVWRFSPVLRPLCAASSWLLGTNGIEHAIVLRRRRRRTVTEQCGEPLLVEGGVHPR